MHCYLREATLFIQQSDDALRGFLNELETEGVVSKADVRVFDTLLFVLHERAGDKTKHMTLADTHMTLDNTQMTLDNAH